MLSYRDLLKGLRQLGLGSDSLVLVHADFRRLGGLVGDGETAMGALLATSQRLITPAFTTGCMIVPSSGPPNNGLDYAARSSQNLDSQFFEPGLLPDPELGDLPAAMLGHPKAHRSSHPLLSFVGIGVEQALETQSLEAPLAPIGWLADHDGDVLLLGADHRANVSLHYAELLTGRRTFLRWALTPQGVVACPGMPGCQDGFNAIEDRLQGVVRQAEAGPATIEAVPLRDLINIAAGWIRASEEALLCSRPACERCAAVRATLHIPGPSPGI
jgi:aminoglycoside 3-N-acetyltransferase